MPRSTVLDLAQEEQAQMLDALQRARWLPAGPAHLAVVCRWCT